MGNLSKDFPAQTCINSQVKRPLSLVLLLLSSAVGNLESPSPTLRLVRLSALTPTF